MDPSIEPDWNVKFTREEMERIRNLSDKLDQGRARRAAAASFGTVYHNGAARRSKRRIPMVSKAQMEDWIWFWKQRVRCAEMNG